eukprot:5088678-Pyramimonas_sp.AAC.1
MGASAVLHHCWPQANFESASNARHDAPPGPSFTGHCLCVPRQLEQRDWPTQCNLAGRDEVRPKAGMRHSSHSDPKQHSRAGPGVGHTA